MAAAAIDNPGFSLQACDWDLACSAVNDGSLDYLAALPCSIEHIALLGPIRAGDILHLSTALMTLIPDSDVPFDFDRYEANDGTCADRLRRAWVKQFSRLHETDGPNLFAAWVAAYEQEEHIEPAWHNAVEQDYGTKVITTCAAALANCTDLVMIWRL
ncbi:hypothetical protein [Lignipirellula cremea]|uniref:hypothetical protein n=1 Tax=Lignipirellula cremea TaxID=2528010 RepID=UPI0011A7A646|nr:hypothetical protein [Lignipirellula cremea]